MVVTVPLLDAAGSGIHLGHFCNLAALVEMALDRHGLLLNTRSLFGCHTSILLDTHYSGPVFVDCPFRPLQSHACCVDAVGRDHPLGRMDCYFNLCARPMELNESISLMSISKRSTKDLFCLRTYSDVLRMSLLSHLESVLRCFAICFVVFCQLSLATSLAASGKTLYYAAVGSGISEGFLFRTVFNWMNEDSDEITGELRLFSRNGDAFEGEFSRTWVGEEGIVSFTANQVAFSIPPKSSLVLAMVPSASPSLGMARLEFSGDLKQRVVLQVGKLPPKSDSLLPQFEHYIESEAEIFATTGLKAFSFPIHLFLGAKQVNTAFSIVNLSSAPGMVRLTLRPATVKTITLQPGEMIADYFDRFWELAFPEIFPFQLSSVADVTSDLPLGVAVFKTVQGLPISGVRVISSTAEEETVKVELGTEFKLAINQTASIQAEGLSVIFWDVTEDSRCPVDVTCVQAGKATIMLRVSQNDQNPEEIMLSTSPGEDKAPFDQYLVELVGVEPTPISTQSINISDYRIRLLITGQ